MHTLERLNLQLHAVHSRHVPDGRNHRHAQPRGDISVVAAVASRSARGGEIAVANQLYLSQPGLLYGSSIWPAAGEQEPTIQANSSSCD